MVKKYQFVTYDLQLHGFLAQLKTNSWYELNKSKLSPFSILKVIDLLPSRYENYKAEGR